ncbi:helix-turn-helix transcriptional regulator [Actinoplanes sp. L3-i22]|uniref:helix-turn-helix domain-containing protein n=1 Tax=Actinoplanes sp. L3-i22 TaxID=2836373 RepID=UPI001C78D7D3|nr:helix-turn-helix transcriptional regulator [Actinoplanes sp. L3-i22]BCY11065.1 hypothetical protein L3i22_061530 [Actinoplanes sp. L3-i22]
MADPQSLRIAWRDLGQQLATRRKATEMSQQDLANKLAYSRSSIANIETGLQHVNRAFWEAADDCLGGDGELIRGYDTAESLQRSHQRPTKLQMPRFNDDEAAEAAIVTNLSHAPRWKSEIAIPQADRLVADTGEWGSFSQVTAMLAQQRQAVPPGALLSLVEAHRDCLSTLYRKAKRDPLRADIGIMLGEASIVASRLWSAQGNRAMALAHCVYARQLADRFGSARVGATARIFESNLHSEAATLIEEDGDIMIGLRLLEEAEAAVDYLTPAARARIAAEQAQAYAALNLRKEADFALGRAEEAVSGMTKEHCTGLYSDWGPARLLVYKGTCQTLLGEHSRAVGTLQEATKELRHDAANNNVLLAAKVDLATAYAGSGHLESSCSLLADTYRQLKVAGNRRGLGRAERARERLSPWNGERAVVALDESMAAA